MRRRGDEGPPADRDTRASASSPSTSAERPTTPAPSSDVGPDATPRAPAIELPKGGGAIQGIGEKFSVNPATGTASFQVPVFASPGRDGFGPSLSLRYDSGSGNGPFGLGWSLSVPSIRRKTSKGVPRYCDGPEPDVFLLSGAEDLVPGLREASPGDWVADEWSRTESGDPFDVRAYRPRTEGGFRRIERWTARDTGEVHWRVRSPENVVGIFGLGGGRVVDPEDPGRVFAWLLTERRDGKGNLVRYEYKAEDGAGVDALKPEEEPRLRRGASFARRYLKRIRYGNRTLDPDAEPEPDARWLFEVVLDYGEHDDQAPTPAEVRPWAVRPDPFSSYRSGFELRTYRRCRRVLMFHRFPELSPNQDPPVPVLVRSTDFTYRDDPHLSYLTGVTAVGYQPLSGGGYATKTLPTLELEYTEPAPDGIVYDLDPESLENVPVARRGQLQWLDLDGEGIPGVLCRESEGWGYKRNLGEGRLGSMEPLVDRPATAGAGAPAPRFMDLDGDGQREAVHLSEPAPGFYARGEASWESFRAFESSPEVDWRDPNLRFVDLTGDGLSDVLVTEEDALTWLPSRQEEGFGEPRRRWTLADEDAGPRVVFADGRETIHLADMSGDGLTDLVRIREADVCYWPNLGHGRFGPKVTMDASPVLDSADDFDPALVRLVDADGSGTTDLLYLGGETPRLWRNQAGNGWGPPEPLDAFPDVDDASGVAAVDLLGTGTACLVWSSALPDREERRVRYLDLTGGVKPHLLDRIENNLGAVTELTYAASTRFYLDDRIQGRPWLTRLPFPVQVVERVEVHEEVTDTRLVTRYAYHHGYFDGVEREFRGFGMVERWDAEELGVDPRAADYGSTTELSLPPVHTRTWFHTGAFPDARGLPARYAAEYWDGDSDVLHPAATRLPPDLSPSEEREAHRTLRGRRLRREVYARDGSDAEDRPYLVEEASYEVRRLQPGADERHAVFFPHDAERLTHHYEREFDEVEIAGETTKVYDPRVAHALTLEVDAFGNVLESVELAHPRRTPEHPEQGEPHAILTERSVANRPYEPDWYRVGVPLEERRWELGVDPADLPLSFEELRDVVATATGVAFKDAVAPGEKRLIAHRRWSYEADDLTGALPFGTIESLGLLREVHDLALTPGLVSQVCGTRVSGGDFVDAGYWPGFVHDQGNPAGLLEPDTLTDPDSLQDPEWWIPSGRPVYGPDAPSHFYQPNGFRDPYGQVTLVQRDPHDLLLTRTEDPLGNVVEADNDYRVLQASTLTDPNENRTEVAFDALGRVTARARRGAPGEGLGDTLADPTARFEYHPEAWSQGQGPAYVRIEEREVHQHQDEDHPDAGRQIRFVYGDGLGREVATKTRVAPGDAPKVVGGEVVVQKGLKEHWVGSGRVVFDNKGNPVKQYEPFFSATRDFETEVELVEWGVTPVLRHDPLGRLIRTDNPDGTFSKVELDPWRREAWDENDTVLKSDWFADRDGQPGPEGRAASAAAVHANTPEVEHLDPLGRSFLHVEDNGPDGRYETRLELDVQDNERRIVDALGRDARTTDFDLAGRPLHVVSIDAGESWSLPDAAGEPFRAWDGRGYSVRYTYDDLRRPRGVWVAKDGGSERLAQLTVYGEGASGAVTKNLRGRAYLSFDGAGLVVHRKYDFTGNLAQSERRLLVDYAADSDWSAQHALSSPQTILDDLAQNPGTLEGETFEPTTSYDALGRPLIEEAPDGSVVRRAYDEGGRLLSVELEHVHGGGVVSVVSEIRYNARGQRTEITYGNGVVTEYTYDPETFRLDRLDSLRSGDFLQKLDYTYDAVGNITEIGDAAQQTFYYDNAVVDPIKRFEYDALYRLTRAEGREHAGQNPGQNQRNAPASGPLPGDSAAMRRYIRHYTLGPVGNLQEMKHQASGAGWTRRYAYLAGVNRLRATSLPGDSPGGPYTGVYTHDAAGHITSMPHLSAIKWDFASQIRRCDLGGGEHAWYAYDGAGERVRTVVERSGAKKKERIYVGGYEVFRRMKNGSLEKERTTVHVMDDERRVAIVETLVRDDGLNVGNPDPRTRYQFDDHLGSAGLELDDSAKIISYEEYHPYGTSAYYATPSQVDVNPKRYRYSGKERDEETGLHYYGARYYASWLGRWTSPDPAGMVDGVNLYAFVRGDPVGLRDPAGTQGNPSQIAAAETRQSVPEGWSWIEGKGLVYTLEEYEVVAEREAAELGGSEPSPVTFHLADAIILLLQKIDAALMGSRKMGHLEKAFTIKGAPAEEDPAVRVDYATADEWSYFEFDAWEALATLLVSGGKRSPEEGAIASGKLVEQYFSSQDKSEHQRNDEGAQRPRNQPPTGLPDKFDGMPMGFDVWGWVHTDIRPIAEELGWTEIPNSVVFKDAAGKELTKFEIWQRIKVYKKRHPGFELKYTDWFYRNNPSRRKYSW